MIILQRSELSSGEKADLEIKNQKSEFEDDPQKGN